MNVSAPREMKCAASSDASRVKSAEYADRSMAGRNNSPSLLKMLTRN